MAEVKPVAVLIGGWAAERPVSLSSGTTCADSPEAAGYRITRVDVDRDIGEALIKSESDIAINTPHDPLGKDGAIQGLPDAQNRIRQRNITAAEDSMNHPCVVKTVAEGFPFGDAVIRINQSDPSQLLDRKDGANSKEIMIERYVPGGELACAVMGQPGKKEALGASESVPIDQEFYDYDANYIEGGSKHVVPAELKPNIYQKVCTVSLEAHRALGCRGVTRSDFRYDEHGDGEVVWLEVDTQPGMTRTLPVPELAAHKGVSFVDLVDWLVEDASCAR